MWKDVSASYRFCTECGRTKRDIKLTSRMFIETGAVQCGFCTPGIILTLKALFDVNPDPSEEDIRRAIEGNLCRCTGYTKY